MVKGEWMSQVYVITIWAAPPPPTVGQGRSRGIRIENSINISRKNTVQDIQIDGKVRENRN